MKKLMLLLLCFMIAGMQLLQAQGVTITGKTTNVANGEAIPGVSIVVKGTTIGTISQFDGTYKLTVPADATNLLFSFVGMKTQDVVIGGRASIDVALEEEATELNEIVVVGYSTQKKQDITGSVSVVKAEDLNSMPAPDLGKQLEGRAAGVQISQSGDPTGNASIRIRGIGSVNDNSPLLVIDGVSTLDQTLNNINPNDIESIQILKDASSSSIYGAQASNGVIIITTKHGTKGKATISYTGYYGVQKNIKWYDLLDANGWMNMWDRAQRTTNILKMWGAPKPDQGGVRWDGVGQNTDKTFDQLYNDPTIWAKPAIDKGTAPNLWMYYSEHPQFGAAGSVSMPDFIIPSGVHTSMPDTMVWTPTNRVCKIGDTDWGAEILQTAPVQNHQITAQGGNEAGVYAFGFNYFDQKGIVTTTYLKRYSVRANSELKVKEHIKLGENMTIAFVDNHGVGQNSEGWAGSMAYRTTPWIPVYDIAGNWAGSAAKGAGNANTPLAGLMRGKNNKSTSLRLFGNLYAEINFLKDFTFKTSFGLDYNDWKGFSMGVPNPEAAEPSTITTFNEYHNYNMRWVFNNTLTYRKQLGEDHSITVLAGTEAIDDGMGRGLDGTRYGYLAANDNNTWTLGNGSTSGMSNNSYFMGEYTLFGMFARADYAFKNRYLFTGIVRRDGVSRFSKSNRYGTFPSASIGWRFSEEDFMQSLTFIDDAKLRIGYGVTGNSQIPRNYNYAFTYGYDSRDFNYDLGGTNGGSMTGMKQTAAGNMDTKWEQSQMTNVGLDLSMLNYALEVNLDVYTKKTSGMLVEDNYSALAGGVGAPYVNLGDMTNKGFDLGLTYRGKAGDLRYDATATISHYKNEVVKISNNDATKFYGGGSRFGNTTIITKGLPISTFWGYEVEGIYKSKEELQNHATQPDINNKATDFQDTIGTGTMHDVTKWMSSLGKFKFKDINGDGVINNDDKTAIGNPHPDFTYSLDINLYYKSFELNLFFVGSQGNDIYNYVKYWTDFNGSFIGNRNKTIMTDSWLPGLGDTRLPIMDINNTQDANNSTSFYVEDGSYFRCKNLQLAYNLPKNLLTKIGVDNMKIYGQVTNLFTITKYTGLDPDLGLSIDGGTSDWDKGLDFGNYPTPRTFMVGLVMNL